jgi:hypothetical protein
MLWKSVSTIFTATAVSVGISVLNTPVTSSQTKPQPQIAFVCASEINPPTTFVYTPGEIILKPILSWYSDYLLPNDSAEKLCQTVTEKLQSKYDQGQKFFLASQKVNDRWQVCLVTQKGAECNSKNSEELFSVNANYKTPECIMENTEPKSCPNLPTTRGPVLSIPGGRYTRIWWFF